MGFRWPSSWPRPGSRCSPPTSCWLDFAREVDVLGSGARDLPDRQRTLRSTIEWSYDLLDRDECRVFEMMSVFSAARLDAIEEVAKSALGEVDAVEVLASLVDKSLVRTVGDGEIAPVHDAANDQGVRGRAAGGGSRDPTQLSRWLMPASTAGTPWTIARASRDPTASRLSKLWWPRSGTSAPPGAIGSASETWSSFVSSRMFSGPSTRPGAGITRPSSLPPISWRYSPPPRPPPTAIVEEMTLRAGLARALMAGRGYSVEVERQYGRVLELSSS